MVAGQLRSDVTEIRVLTEHRQSPNVGVRTCSAEILLALLNSICLQLPPKVIIVLVLVLAFAPVYALATTKLGADIQEQME